MGIYLVTHLQRWLNQEIRNTFYYGTSVGEPSVSEWQDIVDEIRADYVDIGIGDWVNDWEFYGIDVRRVDSAGLLSFRYLPTSGTLVGTGATDSVATQVALLVSVKGTTTKPNQARTYMGGLMEVSMTDSQWSSAIQANGEDLIDNMALKNVAGTNPIHRVAAQWNTSHTMVTATNDISTRASKASAVPATQRRRRIGVGI